jgi:hypothetical protein
VLDRDRFDAERLQTGEQRLPVSAHRQGRGVT